MPTTALTSDFVFIRRERLRVGEHRSGISEDFEQARSSLAAPDVRPASSSCLHSGGGEWMTADEERLRVSECKAKLAWALPSVSRLERSSRLAAGAEKINFYRRKTLKFKINVYLCTRNVIKIQKNMATTTATAPKRRISKAMRWARAHKGFIYEVTDPELRSQLANYRNKEKKDA